MTQPHIESTIIEYAAVTDLQPHPNNAREGDIGAIITSIKENGWFGTLVVQKSTKYILAGNHRYKAAVQIGMTHVPVYWVDCDDQRALAILVADNRTSDIGRWNEDGLLDILVGLQSADMLLGTGYDDEDIAKLMGEMTEDPLPKEEPMIQCPKCGERFSAKPKKDR